MDRIRCFFLTPTEDAEQSLRRFKYRSAGHECQVSGLGYHDASVVIGQANTAKAELESRDRAYTFPHDDPRWPAACKCGYRFVEEDEWQYNSNVLYRRSDNGELTTLRSAPVGAMWFAPWYSDLPQYRGPDGQTLVVRAPGNHDWMIDGRCSNCTMPNDDVHKCWVRHGTPPDITVDKNGVTCKAGGGSLGIPGWHGFLRSGWLEKC